MRINIYINYFFFFVCLFGPIIIFSQSRNLEIRDSLLEQLKLQIKPEEQFEILTEVCNTYVYTSQSDSIFYYSNQMKELAQRLKCDSLYGTALAYEGCAFSMTKETDTAISRYFESLSILEKGNYYYRKSFVLKQIAFVFRDLKDYTSSLAYLNKAKIYLPDGILPNRVYTNLADAYIGIMEIDSALIYAQKAHRITNKHEDSYGYCRSLYLLGIIYIEKQFPDLGLTYLNECLKFSRDQQIVPTQITSLAKMAQYELKQQHFAIAKSYALQSVAISKQQMQKSSLLEDYHVLADIYIKENKKDSFLFYQQLKSQLEQSFEAESFVNNLQQHKINQFLLEQEQTTKNQKAALAYKQKVQYSLILLIIICLLAFIMIFSSTFLANMKVISFMSTLIILSSFEFISLLFHPILEEITHHSPWQMLLMLSLMAIIFIPAKQKLEEYMNRIFEARIRSAKLKYAQKYMNEMN